MIGRIGGGRQQPRGKGVLTVIMSIAFGVMIAVATVGLGTALDHTNQTALPPNGLATGLGALALVESQIARQSNLTWVLVSDVGIATHAPFTPGVAVIINDVGALSTMWACASLPFVSVWNASGLPQTPENLSDGFAAFWQFMFDNETPAGGSVWAIGTYSAGTVSAATDLGDQNPCIQALGLSTGGLAPGLEALPNLDTNLAGPAAYRAVSPVLPFWAPEWGANYAILWTDGFPVISNNAPGSVAVAYGDGWMVTFYACGLAYFNPAPSPSEMATVAVRAGVGMWNGTVTVGGITGIGSFCTNSNYHVTLGPAHGAAGPAGYTLGVGLNVSSGDGNHTSNDTQGVAAWMVEPVLTLPTGASIGPTIDGCPAWVPTVHDCRAPAHGWYAVLTSPTGQWVDSYGASPGGGGWASLNAPIVSNESLVIVSSDPLAGSGDTLMMFSHLGVPEVNSTVANL